MRRLAAALLLSGAALAAGPAFGADFKLEPEDGMQAVLEGQKGKRITLRLRSGQEFTGTVKQVTPRLVRLGVLGGREFFDAVIPLESVEAVLLRIKE